MRVFYPWAKVILSAIYEGDDEKVVSSPVYPLEVTVECNSYREADTAKVVCNFKEQPIDPRLVRSLAIQVHMDTKSSAGGETNCDDSNLMFVGFVDVPSMEFSDDGSKVSFEARDYTALLIDTMLGDEMIDLRKPVDQIVKALLAEEAAFAEIEVVLKGIEETPNLSEFKSDWNHKAGTEEGESYWDFIVDLVQQAGLICYIEKDKLIITKAKNLTQDTYVELFLYGKNLKKLKIERDLRKKRAPSIEVRSYDDKQKKTLIGKYPKKDPERKVVSGEDKVDKQEKIRFTVSNINDKARLDQIAEDTYWALVREEMSGSLETEEARTLFSGSDKSLMTLRHGDAVFVGFHADSNGVFNFHSMSDSERQGHLKRMGYPDDLAGVFSKLYDSDKMYGPYYVKKATHKFSVDNGYSLGVDFINFIDADKIIKEAQN